MLHYISDSGPFRLIINTRFLTHHPKSSKKKKQEKTQSNRVVRIALRQQPLWVCAQWARTGRTQCDSVLRQRVQ